MRADVEIAAHLSDERARNRLLPGGEAAQKRVIRNHVDRARNPVRLLMNMRDGVARQDLRTHATGHLDSSGKIGGCFNQRERMQLATKRNPLLQLPDLLAIELPNELRLP